MGPVAPRVVIAGLILAAVIVALFLIEDRDRRHNRKARALAAANRDIS